MENAGDDYVLGTHDEELDRLGLQHRVWRSRVLDAWRRAGFTEGQTILDVGCGPGFAALDLAEIVGPTGRVVAIDQSRRFLAHAARAAQHRSLANVETAELNLDRDPLPALQADGAWCRWVLAFVADPRATIQRISRALRPGGVFVSYEYFAYDAWRFFPPMPELTEFVEVVCEGWRKAGGEPDIGLQLPTWLVECGFEIVDARPIVEIVTPDDYMWQWPKAFIRTGTARYVELGNVSRERADEILAAFQRGEQQPGAMMSTPAVLEIIARRLP